jgi:hypothetical protein
MRSAGLALKRLEREGCSGLQPLLPFANPGWIMSEGAGVLAIAPVRLRLHQVMELHPFIDPEAFVIHETSPAI